MDWILKIFKCVLCLQAVNVGGDNLVKKKSAFPKKYLRLNQLWSSALWNKNWYNGTLKNMNKNLSTTRNKERAYFNDKSSMLKQEEEEEGIENSWIEIYNMVIMF